MQPDPDSEGQAPGAGRPGATMRVLVAGATGYIGRHVTRELVRRGHDVVAFSRPRAGIGGGLGADEVAGLLPGAGLRLGDATDAGSVLRHGFCDEPFDAVVSCLASRTGGVEDSWRVDYRANRHLLAGARSVGAEHFVLLSAICVQKPRLAFQRAKLAFEAELAASDLTHSIVRPTAYFKSLAGQVLRIQRGKPFLLIGPGDGPVCKPISEEDVARFVADCLEDPDKRNRVLPIGGPGPAVSARERGELLFELAGRAPRFRRVPLALFDAMIPLLATGAALWSRLDDTAEFARIGRYYATESMLALDPETGAYEADATPSYGSDTLRDFYARVLREGLAGQELGDQALF